MSLVISHHLLLCATSKKSLCCKYEDGKNSWEHLKKIIQELNLENPKRPQGIVLRSKVDCLRVCDQGPILLIWPDGIWYKKVSPKLIDLIVNEHILNGNPINDFIIKRTPLNF